MSGVTDVPHQQNFHSAPFEATPIDQGGAVSVDYQEILGGCGSIAEFLRSGAAGKKPLLKIEDDAICRPPCAGSKPRPNHRGVKFYGAKAKMPYTLTLSAFRIPDAIPSEGDVFEKGNFAELLAIFLLVKPFEGRVVDKRRIIALGTWFESGEGFIYPSLRLSEGLPTFGSVSSQYRLGPDDFILLAAGVDPGL